MFHLTGNIAFIIVIVKKKLDWHQINIFFRGRKKR